MFATCRIIALSVLPVEKVRYENIIPESIAYIIPPTPLCIRANSRDETSAAGIKPNLLSTLNTPPLQNNSSHNGAIIAIIRKVEGVSEYASDAEPKNEVRAYEVISITGKNINMSEIPTRGNLIALTGKANSRINAGRAYDRTYKKDIAKVVFVVCQREHPLFSKRNTILIVSRI